MQFLFFVQAAVEDGQIPFVHRLHTCNATSLESYVSITNQKFTNYFKSIYTH